MGGPAATRPAAGAVYPCPVSRRLFTVLAALVPAVLLLVLATAVSVLVVRLSGYEKMQSTMEGL